MPCTSLILTIPVASTLPGSKTVEETDRLNKDVIPTCVEYDNSMVFSCVGQEEINGIDTLYD